MTADLIKICRCGTKMDEVLEQGFRICWVCWKCWPDPDSVHRCIGRERVVKPQE